MDPATHALLGGALAGAVTNQLERRWMFMAGAAGALLPDLDVLIRSTADPLLFLEYHRHFTHSLVAAPVIGLIVALLFRWLLMQKRLSFAALAISGTLGALSHGLLDAATSYGVLLLWPWDDSRITWNLVSVVDPLVSLPLLLLVVSGLLADRQVLFRFAVAWLVLMLAFGYWQRERASGAIENLARERGHFVSMHTVKPSFANQIVWRSIYLHRQTFYVDVVRAGRQVEVLAGEQIDWQPWETLDLPHGSRQQMDMRRFDRFAQGYTVLWPGEPAMFGDVRFSMMPDSARPLWGVGLHPDDPQRPAQYLTDREISEAERSRFLDLIFGRVPMETDE